MINEDDNICFCPIEGLMKVISKKWAIQIIATIGNYERIRFNELQKVLPGISSKTLSDRLKDYIESELVNKTVYAEIPPRTEYSLTRNGIEARNAMLPMLKWISEKSSQDKLHRY